MPLGPFNAKNFATTISSWVITAEALEPFKVDLPTQDPQPLEYLKGEKIYSYDIELDVLLKTNKMEEAHVITKSNMKHLYWSVN